MERAATGLAASHWFVVMVMAFSDSGSRYCGVTRLPGFRPASMAAIPSSARKPIASLVDGTFAGIFGFRIIGLALALPALVPIVVMSLRPSFGKRLVHHANFNPVG